MSKKIKIGIIGSYPNIHLQRKLLTFDDSLYDITIISTVFYKKKINDKYNIFSININNYKYLKHFKLIYYYYKFLRNQKFDVLYCFSALSPISWLAGIACNNNLVVSTIGSDVFLRDQLQISFINQANIKRLIKTANVVTVLSKAMERRLIKDFNISSKRILKDFLDLESIWYTQKTYDTHCELFNNTFPIILSPRMLQPLYRQENIIKALYYIKQQFPNVLLLQTKYGKDVDYYKKCLLLINKLNLENNIKFLDNFNQHSDIIQYYDVSDIVLMIPKSDGMPATMIEAWVRKKPVIVSDIDNYDETDNQRLFLKSQVDELALKQSVYKILQNKTLKNNLISNSSEELNILKNLSKKLIIFDLPLPRIQINNFYKLINLALLILFLLEPLIINFLKKLYRKFHITNDRY